MSVQEVISKVVFLMNDLIVSMSNDMKIDRHKGETTDSFIYRVIYSGLGQWCLWTANGKIGTTKRNQSLVINQLLQRFAELFPTISEKFTASRKTSLEFSAHIRTVYEETGYLISNENNRNELVNFGRGLYVDKSSKYPALYFGVPNEQFIVNGLGVFAASSEYKIKTEEFLIRDNLSVEEYILAKYDVTDFYEKDVNVDQLQFFNPLMKSSLSQSWSTKMDTDYSVARTGEFGFYYRVIKEPGGNLIFANEVVEQERDSLTSYEYRRLYYALKAYYNNPLRMNISSIDEKYAEVRLAGHLPNREYYYLLLLAWPKRNAFDKTNFLVRKEFIPEIIDTLHKIGIKTLGGYY